VTEDNRQNLVNVGMRLSVTADSTPDATAVAVPLGRDRSGKRRYQTLTYRELDDDSNRLAAGLVNMGVRPGMRIVLLVRLGIDFISLVFALFKTGAVIVLIDPGMGRRRMLECLREVEPDGFVAIPVAHAIRVLMGRRFGKARLNVTVGRRWFWGGRTIRDLRRSAADAFRGATTQADDPAAIIFTSGATGPAKGVLFHHGTFNHQVEQIREFYDIRPGGIDVACFPLFALFNAAMGTSTILPKMDPSRPAQVDPRNIVEAVHDFQATQAFASPAVWNVVGRYCEQRQVKMPSLRRVLSAGAPVPAHVLARIKSVIAPDGDMHTPYGATEALPVASIAASEVLSETAARSDDGAGTCVGRRFSGIQWQVIRITDDPIDSIEAAEPLATGEIGELIVCGPVVTREYVTQTHANRKAKIRDGGTIWHRMGDVGYLDENDRFWFCGRKAHRVRTADGPMYPVPCEAILNCHWRVFRSALVGVGAPGEQEPVLVAELWPGSRPESAMDEQDLKDELLRLIHDHPITQRVGRLFLHDGLPVDVRHNAKINREELARWAERQMKVAE
jgi:acyl-CoA synthetase (AMP-forming)/AMP-acid ligase II